MGSNMADTDANAQLREEYKQILSSLREKKVLHQRYLNCTTDLLKQLKTCSSHISMIQYFLESGGYISSGEILDQDNFVKHSNDVENAIEILESNIKATETLIDDIKSDINAYEIRLFMLI